jgi:hypothetical protein
LHSLVETAGLCHDGCRGDCSQDRGNTDISGHDPIPPKTINDRDHTVTSIAPGKLAPGKGLGKNAARNADPIRPNLDDSCRQSAAKSGGHRVA